MLQLIYVLTIVFAALVYLMWQLNRLIMELRKTIDALTDLIKSANKLKKQLKKFLKRKKRKFTIDRQENSKLPNNVEYSIVTKWY